MAFLKFESSLWVAVTTPLVLLAVQDARWLLLLVLAWLMYYLCAIVERPCLICGPKVETIVAKCSSLFADIYYTPWACNGHIQSILFAFWPQTASQHRSHNVKVKREFVSLADGGQIALDWCLVSNSTNFVEHSDAHVDVIVLLLPGITGKSGNACLTRLAQHLYTHKGATWRCVVKHWRGIGAPLSVSQSRAESWDSHAVHDTIESAVHISQAYPLARLVCVGFSHGGNICLGALADSRRPGLFSAGVALSAPFDFEAVMNFLETNQVVPYAFANVKSISKSYMASGAKSLIMSSLPGAVEGFREIQTMLSCTNLAMHSIVRRPYGSTWHEFITRRYTGHESVPKYYQSVTQMVQNALPEITVPVLCLLAEDDPLAPPLTFRHLINKEQNPWIVVSLTKRGGHCGWFYGIRGLSWLNEATFEFLQVCLDEPADNTQKSRKNDFVDSDLSGA